MTGNKIVAKNRNAYHDFDLLEKIEAGIVLVGKEIKAIRDGKVDLTGSYARIMQIAPADGQELFWLGGRVGIGEGSDRTKKLLVHGSELKNLIGKSQIKGLTLVPLELYLKHGRAKLCVAVARGRKLHDKRAAIKKKDIDRQQRRGE
ncbi:hypothetical protein AUK41_02280 [Candidatus Berkelbacteria bacterium CG2_30_43_20]|nr:MAG: hypothetical protein AUK41_02280 [Candidatus Berkelbacteria bacterium CG2_30_43_20]